MLLAASPGWSVGHLFLLVAGVGLLLVAGWSSWRRRRRAGVVAEMRVDHRPSGDNDESLEAPSAPSSPSSVVGVDTSGDGAAVEELLFSTAAGATVQRCPKCQRTFPAAFDICPFDTAVLETAKGEGATRSGPEGAKTRRYCTDCGRRYEANARHCIYDGQLLRPDSCRATEEAPTFRICTGCGWHAADTEREFCPRDQGRLVVLNPASRDRRPPVFPFHRCRQCGHIGAPDQLRCPVDATILVPASSAAPRAIPSTGFGARRRVCPDCGTRFDDQCRYCSRDGTRLVALN